jgi:hypothetical protein
MPTLDVPDEHGHSFGEYVTAILQENTSDYAAYQDADKPPDAEQLWTAELEQQWPRIQLVVRRMFAAHREHQRRHLEKRRRFIRRRLNQYTQRARRQSRLAHLNSRQGHHDARDLHAPVR